MPELSRVNFLITGATGFIGSALCSRLQSLGHGLTVLSRSRDRAIDCCGGNVRSVERLSELQNTEQFDAIVNLAGEPVADRRWSAGRKQLLRESRISLTEQLCSFVQRADKKPALLISASAVGFYGDQGDHVLDEQSDAVNDFPHQLCRDWEQAALALEPAGLRVCILRIGLVVGDGGGFLKKMRLPFKWGVGGTLGDGEQWMSWVHRDDLIAMILFLMEHEVLNGVFNATAPHPVTNAQFTQLLGQQFARPASLPIPAGLLQLLCGEMSTLLLGGQRVMPLRLQRAGFNFQYEHLPEALRSCAI